MKKASTSKPKYDEVNSQRFRPDSGRFSVVALVSKLLNWSGDTKVSKTAGSDVNDRALVNSIKLDGFNLPSSILSEQLSLSLLSALDDTALVAITDKKGKIIYANNKFVEISKYSHQELIGQNHRILKSGHHPDEFFAELWRTITKGKVWRGEIKNRAKDGTYYWIDAVIAPVFKRDGSISKYIAVRFPVTEHKRVEKLASEKSDELEITVSEVQKKNTELEKSRSAILNILEDLDEEKKLIEVKVDDRTKELQQEKDKLLLVTSHMRGGALLLDENQVPIFVNDEARHMLNKGPRASYQAVTDRFFDQFASLQLLKYFKKCEDNSSFSFTDVEVDNHMYELHVSCVNSGDQKSNNFFILFFDVTETKLLERSKTELVAVASHQLRTPLTAMRGNIEMLLDESFGSLSDTQREMLNETQQSTVRLIEMVNEMLDITKIERGDLEMTLEQFNLATIVSSIEHDLSDYADRRRFEIVHNIPDERPLVYGDRLRVRQVLQNLIDNAIKYSQPPGHLQISYQRQKDSIEVILKDNGIGIPETEHSRIFGRFYRASNSVATSASGSGLGLYIVKAIIEQMNGSIRFESAEDEGTTFYVVLPIDSS